MTTTIKKLVRMNEGDGGGRRLQMYGGEVKLDESYCVHEEGRSGCVMRRLCGSGKRLWGGLESG